jgi:hypothetical protein
MNLEEGAVVAGRYRVGKTLGRGGMGAVYEAWDERLEERVALKVTLATGPAAAEVQARFAREAQLSNRLGRAQPRIVRARDWSRLDADRLYLVMDLVDGARPLDLKGGDVRARVARVREAAALVAVMHAAGAVHRDLKPANLLQSADGHVHLTDLGLAKLTGEAPTPAAEHGLTQTGVGMGTPGFMPLEQFSDAARVDARADVWALGCMLFAALCGQYPFGGGMSEVLTRLMQVKHREVAPPRPRDHDPAVPAPLDDLVAAALSLEPAGRPADAGAFVAALDAAVSAAGWPSLAEVRPTTSPGTTRTPATPQTAQPAGDGGALTAGAWLTGSAPATDPPGPPAGTLPLTIPDAGGAGAVPLTIPDPGRAAAPSGPQALVRRARRLLAAPFVAAPVGGLVGVAGGLLTLALAAAGTAIDDDVVTTLGLIVGSLVTLLAAAAALLELVPGQRAVRLGVVAVVASVIVGIASQADGDASSVLAIGGAALLSLMAARGLAAWPLVAAATGLATAVTTAVCMGLDDAWNVRNLGMLPSLSLAAATAAGALALVDRLDARLAGEASPVRAGGRVGAAALALAVLAFVASALTTGGWARPPVDLGPPRLEVLSVETGWGPHGRGEVRVRCEVSDAAPCDVRAEVGTSYAVGTWSPGDGPVDLVVPWPDGVDVATWVWVNAADRAGNYGYASREVMPPPPAAPASTVGGGKE